MHKAKPSLCIAMATYNGEKFLSRQIDSILHQSYQDFELIIYDDNSNDNTVEIILSYMKSHDRIKLYQNNENIGMVKNFENALKKCDSNYIALADQDDIWHKDKLKISMQELKKAEHEDFTTPILVHSDLEMIDEHGNMLSPSYFNFRKYQLSPEKSLNTILSQNGVMGNTILINNNLKKLILPFPNNLIVHDYWIALINEIYGKRITIHTPLVQYRIHTKNLSNSTQVFQHNYIQTIKKILTLDLNLPYMRIGREKVLKSLLTHYKLSKNDRKTIEEFLIYLDFNTNRLNIFYTLIKFDFIKKGFFYRFKLFIKLMFTRKYVQYNKRMKSITGIAYYYKNIIAIISDHHFMGWGRKRTGHFALYCHQKFGGTLTLLEDGFIRSIGLGINNSPSFSLVEDDIGIYYDATTSSKLEKILNTYNFNADEKLMQTADHAMALMKDNHISKYNHASDVDEKFRIKFGLNDQRDHMRILIVTQTSGDASLQYGLSGKFSTKQIIEDAMCEHPRSSIYIKMHPDVLSGKKKSDIEVTDIPSSCTVIDEDVNPVSLLKYFDKVYTKTSGMGFEALLLGKKVVCYGLPYYAGWGLTEDKLACSRRIKKLKVEELFAGSYILYTQYYNPYSQQRSNITDTIKSIMKYRDIYRQNQGSLYFFGFSRWKRRFTIPFFSTLEKQNIVFCSNLEDGLRKDLNSHSKIFIWGKKAFSEVERYAKEQNISLHRVEDGFIRSVSLGSDLTKAYSLVVDSRGIYFDPMQESDLEQLLNTYDFEDELLERAKNLQEYLIKNKISKYNIYKENQLELKDLNKGQKVIMVPGQVEDDASIIYGADGMTNLELLKSTRENSHDAYIIYKPHPDVLAGNRKGAIDKVKALKYCNTIIEKASIDSVLEKADEVHTITSLVGFEALMRGKKVYTYGLPFYAGWGLTTDARSISRRSVKRTIEELIAATLILYPRYIHPKTNVFCEVEVLLAEIEKEKKKYNDYFMYSTLINNRNFISRKTQLLLKIFLGK